MFNPLANMAQTIQMMQQFQQQNGINENNAYSQVQQNLNNGTMSQQQLNQILPLAEKIYMMMHPGMR